jgi:methylmalonyl-CoA/ethylmalonyl-CoA epimerase
VVRNIHHVNIVVRDLAAAISSYQRLLGTPVVAEEDLPGRGARTARFSIGDSWLVLVSPTRADSVPGRFLAEHGEGLFLLSLGVDSLAAEFDRVGPETAAGEARAGLAGWQVRDLAMTGCCGAQLQFCEEPPR